MLMAGLFVFKPKTLTRLLAYNPGFSLHAQLVVFGFGAVVFQETAALE